MKSRIVRCTRDDYEPMLEMAADMHYESPVYRDLPLDAVKLVALADAAIFSPSQALLMAATDADGKFVGMIGAVATEEYFGPSITTCDLFLYVRPEQRGGMTAFRLIKRYQKWAESIGATRINLGITTGLFLNETGRLFEAAGFSHSGHQYTRINSNGKH